MKSIVFLTAAALLLGSGAAFALECEKGMCHEEKPEIMGKDYHEFLGDHLKLDKEQRKKIKTILKDSQSGLQKRLKAIRKQREKMRKLKEQMDREIRSVHEKIREELTFDQKDRFDEMRLRGKRKRRERMRGVPVEPGELPPEVLEEMEKRGRMKEWMKKGPRPEQFPPEMWEEGPDYERGDALPPEIRRHIEKIRKRRKPPPGEKPR